MKANLISLAVAASVLLAATQDGWALPPRQHTVSGVITSIDFDTHTIALIPVNSGQSLSFVWNDSTRFSQGWSRICLGALERGQPVKISYRRELGQRVSRQVSVGKEISVSCLPGACCNKSS